MITVKFLQSWHDTGFAIQQDEHKADGRLFYTVGLQNKKLHCLTDAYTPGRWIHPANADHNQGQHLQQKIHFIHICIL